MAAITKERRQLERFALKNVENLDVDAVAGSGAYGVVHKVTVNGMQCIAKRVHGVLTGPDVSLKQKSFIVSKFQEECLLTSQLRHPNVVHFVGVHLGSRPQDISLILECLHTDLACYLTMTSNVSLPTKLSVVLDVSYGLLYLHTRDPPIIHRDLTANNILLTIDLRAKIADLGVSKVLDIHRQAEISQTQVPGSQYYMPPEALQETPQYDCKLDIFSLGHMMIFIATQVFPRVHEKVSQLSLKDGTIQILKRQADLDSMGQDHPLYRLTTQCLLDDPKLRPTTLEVNRVTKQLHSQHVSLTAASEVEKLRKMVEDYQADMKTLLQKYTTAIYEAATFKDLLQSKRLKQQNEVQALTEQNHALLQQVASLTEESKQHQQMNKLPKKVKELQKLLLERENQLAGLQSTKKYLSELVKMLVAENKKSAGKVIEQPLTEARETDSTAPNGAAVADNVFDSEVDDQVPDLKSSFSKSQSQHNGIGFSIPKRRNSPHPAASNRTIKQPVIRVRSDTTTLEGSLAVHASVERKSFLRDIDDDSKNSSEVFLGKPEESMPSQKITHSRSTDFSDYGKDVSKYEQTPIPASNSTPSLHGISITPPPPIQHFEETGVETSTPNGPVDITGEQYSTPANIEIPSSNGSTTNQPPAVPPRHPPKQKANSSGWKLQGSTADYQTTLPLHSENPLVEEMTSMPPYVNVQCRPPLPKLKSLPTAQEIHSTAVKMPSYLNLELLKPKPPKPTPRHARQKSAPSYASMNVDATAMPSYSKFEFVDPHQNTPEPKTDAQLKTEPTATTPTYMNFEMFEPQQRKKPPQTEATSYPPYLNVEYLDPAGCCPPRQIFRRELSLPPLEADFTISMPTLTVSASSSLPPRRYVNIDCLARDPPQPKPKPRFNIAEKSLPLHQI